MAITTGRLEIPATGGLERFFERATHVCLAVFVLAAPHSIAVTQGAFVLGCVFWIARMAAGRRFMFARTAVDVPLGLFVGWTVLSVATSLDPAWSADRLRGVSLFFVLYLFATNIPTKRFAWMLALALGISVLGNLWLTYYQRYEGRGLKVVAMHSSPLVRWDIREGDTIMAADGAPIRTIEDLNAAFDGDRRRAPVALRYTRGELEMTTTYHRGFVQDEGPSGPERLGVDVAPGRGFRAQAFFSHPATYAETLQLIGSVLVAFVLVAAQRGNWRWAGWLGALALLVVGALLQTQTRAPIVAFGLAIVAMVVLRGGNRRQMTAVAIAAVVVIVAGAAVVMQGRGLNLFEPTDESTEWRLTVWSEALPLVLQHPLFGIGPDAAKIEAGNLGLFENGKLPPGHFHSTPVQLVVDRGIPALLAWLAFVVVFFVSVGRLVRWLERREADGEDWRVTAATLGAWGSFAGFIASSFVHFNWGDGEPMEMAWCLLGIAFAVARLTAEEARRELR